MEKKTKYEGWLNIVEVGDVNQNGVKINREVMTRSVGKRTDDAVAGMLYDTEKEVYYFVKQYRVGASIRDENPYLVEIVAGTLERGEDPKRCFIREAMEEVGFRVDNVTSEGYFYTSPGGISEKVYLYDAMGVRTEEGGGLDSENEDIEVIEVPLDDLEEFLDSGVILDLKTQYMVDKFVTLENV